MIDNQIPNFIRASNPHELELPGGRYIRVFVGGRDGTDLKWVPPTEDGFAVMPHACRLENKTYELTLVATLEVEYSTPAPITKVFKDVELGRIPLMLRSKLCYLSRVDGFEHGECKYELGGYFIIDGAEKVLLTQETLGNNMFYSGKRTVVPSGESEVSFEKPTAFAEKEEFYTGIRSVSEDASRGPYSHFLVIPPVVAYNEKEARLGQDKRLAVITLAGFKNPVPVLSVLRALGVSTDKELYDLMCIGVIPNDRTKYDDLFYQLILSHERLLRESEKSDLDILAMETHTRSKSEVVRILHERIFPHVPNDADTGKTFRRKAYHLALMLKMTFDVVLTGKSTDRDNLAFKRFQSSGGLFFVEFRRIFRETAKSMLLDLDKKVNQFERKLYEGEKLATAFQPENINRYWKHYRLMNEFLKSFKGAWGGQDGIAQELSRMSYAGAISHLRRTNLPMDRTSNKKEPRRFHASQFGLLCPVDSPDGRNIGYIKSLSVLAQISTAVPSAQVKSALDASKLVRSIDVLTPALWDPRWTPIFLNSVLIGISDRADDLHRGLLAMRRKGDLSMSVSLSWNRLDNVYTIVSDAGRPIRPVYREGTTASDITGQGWSEILKHLDYIDAAETDTIRLSFSFHPTRQSELHTSFNLSALTCLIPFADHNPGTRNAFAIAQTKQTCSWYHTNYRKRFDTIAIMLCNPQKPLTQTWMYNEIMGVGGCMPYGENVIVAITTYGGHNQEDSVMLNASSMARGMFQSLYIHSYDIAESMLDPETQTHTEFANVVTDPDMKRKEDMDYTQLDGEGIIKLGTLVTEKTVLVGIRSPVLDAKGDVKRYNDVSSFPKKGQRGRVDGIYRYTTSEGVHGVKIRIVEERFPEIGDKLGSRHSQKGTCGLILPEQDMPFTSRGVRPDILFNPHALPTRMTIGQWIESSVGKVATTFGAFIDGTPFTTSGRAQTVRDMLRELKFEPHGSEVLYNGFTGEQMEVDIFMGSTYYQRMKHMVEDKINYRTSGSKTLLTHQPLEGRADGGGLRVGEMERDALISHGVSKFLEESFMDRSDATTLQFNKETGQFDTSRDMLDVPWASSLYVNELKSCHVSVKLNTA
jgi:DNA-directed RNA polymerase II subunit RPB2